MACFYCARAKVNSPDAGPCYKCKNNICVDGLSARAHRYHGDTCICGCGELICIYHMDDHARNEHKSTIETCFANTALMVSLVAAAALEDIAGAKSGSQRIDGALSDIGEFLAVVNPPVLDGKPLNASPETALAAFISQKSVPGKAGAHLALDLSPVLPEIFKSVQKSWVKLGDDGQSKYAGELRARLNSLASYSGELAALGFDQDALLAYGTLSPRLQKWARDYAIPHLTEGPEFIASLEPEDLEQGSRRIQRTSRGLRLPDFPLVGKVRGDREREN